MSIEELGIQECFDMTVPDYHNMAIGCLLVHNSIEQDADVVMLLHREAYYHKGEPGWEDNDDAEVIVAKQRNGPTGIVRLRFRSQFTRFESPAQMPVEPTPEPPRATDPPAPKRSQGALPWEL